MNRIAQHLERSEYVRGYRAGWEARNPLLALVLSAVYGVVVGLVLGWIGRW